MKIAIAGSSGFIGTKLLAFLKAEGHSVTPLIRGAYEKGPFDCVINLAGESLNGLWTTSKKTRILESRLETTNSLIEQVETSHFLCTNAIGYYGNAGDETLDEDSPKGEGFLADVCANWEREALKSPAKVTIMRFGIVLGEDGGALSKLKLPFRMGIGTQYISWIHIDDLCRAILFLLTNHLDGVYNLTAPTPIRQVDFAHTFQRVLIPIPEALLNLFPGNQAREMLLSSTKAVPKKLLTHNFKFKYNTLKDILR